MLIPVILSGGTGTRLWPVSREAHPKPFMRVSGGQSLLQKALERAASVAGVSSVLTITNRDYYFQTRDEYAADPVSEGLALDYVLEPAARNTAPAIAMAALYLQQADPEAVMLVLPADHIIDDLAAFDAAAQQAERLARAGLLVTFGMRPSRPETGYGYIQVGEALETGGEPAAFQVQQFVEKPDSATAAEYLASGDFLWNSGMFCFTPAAFLEALQAHAPEVLEAALACAQATRTDAAPVELDADSFAAMPSISVDYAVMERAGNAAVVACDFGWSDLGSWDAVSEFADLDDGGNRLIGEVIPVDTRNTYVRSEDRLVVTLGVSDLVVVDTADALLVADRSRVQEVKRIVDELKARNHEAYRLHRTVHRPWGTYTVLEEGDRFKMKRIVVKPGASLSLQMHHHRSEHWIVVSGTAKVVNGDNEYLVRTNESTYVPAGNAHRLVNPGIVELVMIEVQSGEYLGEDDIVRFEDHYGRA